MFNILATIFRDAGDPDGSAALRVHPGQLSRWLDEIWNAGPQNVTVVPASGIPYLGSPAGVIGAIGKPTLPSRFIDPSGINPANPLEFTGSPGPLVPVAGSPVVWHHLIYAYLLENTGMVEIFAEVLRRAAHGETLEIESLEAVRWLRATEDIFFREAPLFASGIVTSQLRPEARTVRRNAYWRMFGMDLAHPLTTAAIHGHNDWKQHTGSGVNTTFRTQWSELLRQIWLGIENRNNAVGANATDDAYLRLIVDSLRDMMNMRRRAGALAREEFASVALMSWLELTLLSDTPIVSALNANASSPADRLTIIAHRVGMKPAPRSRELFELAELMSLLLRLIELGAFSSAANVALFYNPTTTVYRVVNRIIDLWQSATNERVKDRPAGNVMQGLAQPVRVPSPQPIPAQRLVAVTGNGGRQ
jgi:hypothetical protein